mmetsp:Transcript_5523/g.9729  ORF Transcript_5523/g.9729 Transcript_5523/m.9729 type:complete len:210 (+) Transcript_5523:436-1065(+)
MRLTAISVSLLYSFFRGFVSGIEVSSGTSNFDTRRCFFLSGVESTSGTSNADVTSAEDCEELLVISATSSSSIFEEKYGELVARLYNLRTVCNPSLPNFLTTSCSEALSLRSACSNSRSIIFKSSSWRIGDTCRFIPTFFFAMPGNSGTATLFFAECFVYISQNPVPLETRFIILISSVVIPIITTIYTWVPPWTSLCLKANKNIHNTY